MDTKKTTWREQRISIQKGSVKAVNFIDTKPNYIYFANNSAFNVFASISANVSDKVFDIIIPAFATKMLARQDGMTQIYLANTDSISDVSMTVCSFEGDFDPMNLPQTQEIVGASAQGLLGVIDVNKINSPLPVGTNHLGNVGVDTPLVAGVNHIGSVGIDIPLPAGSNVIGSVGISGSIPTGSNVIGSVNISNMLKNTPKKISLVAATEYVLKATAGEIFKIKSTLTDIILKDGTNEVWGGLGSENFEQGIYFTTSIILLSATGGDVYVSYR